MNFFELVKAGIRNGSRFVTAYEPEILSWLGIGGVWLTASLSAYETPGFISDLEAEGLDDPEIRKERWVDTAKVIARNYYPSIISGIVTSVCIGKGTGESRKREAAAIVAAQMASNNFKELRDKISEEQGEKKLKELESKIAQDHIEKDPPTDANTRKTGIGLSLCREPFSGQYIYTNYKAVYDAAEEMRKLMWEGEFVSAEEWLYLVGVRDLSDEVKARARRVGWQKTTLNDTFTISFGECRGPDGEPCNEIVFWRDPSHSLSEYSFRY